MTMKAFIPAENLIFNTVEQDLSRLFAYCQNLQEQNLTLDLGNVTLCDSAGLAFLIEAKRLARSYKKSCNILGMSKAIQALAEFCGVEKILNAKSTDI